MNFSEMVRIAMLLMSKRQQLTSVFELFNELFAEITGKKPLAVLPKPGTHEEGSMAWLQESLNKLNNAGLKVDGTYGPLTNAAVNAYQKARGLTPDGWAGPETVAKIIEELRK